MTETQRLPPIPDELSSNKYDPTTKIRQTPDGRIEIHSTREGQEGHLDFNSDGSFKYRTATGSVVEFSANNQLFYHKGGFTLTIDNDSDIKISGHSRINVDGDAHIEVAKAASIACNGPVDIFSTSHIKMVATDIYIGSTQGSVVLNAARDMEITANQGRISGHSSGVTSFTTDSGDFHVAAAGMLDLNSNMDAQVVSQGGITTQSNGDTNINASGSVVTKGSSTKIQGGGSSAPPTTFS